MSSPPKKTKKKLKLKLKEKNKKEIHKNQGWTNLKIK
jgi:hypothetical protein